MYRERTMIDKWLENFSKWTPQHQMIFSCIVMGLGLVVLLMVGLWLDKVLARLCVLFRGWPPEEVTEDELKKKMVKLEFPYPTTGYDWKAEQRKIMEEQERERKFQDEVNSRTAEEMDQAGKAWEEREKQLKGKKREPLPEPTARDAGSHASQTA